MIPDSYTVVDPWAMMVETLHTHVTDSTVPRPWGADYFAVRAELCGIELYQ
jgi:hypothetical protein